MIQFNSSLAWYKCCNNTDQGISTDEILCTDQMPIIIDMYYMYIDSKKIAWCN